MKAFEAMQKADELLQRQTHEKLGRDQFRQVLAEALMAAAGIEVESIRIPVEASSNIAAIGYRVSVKQLTVEFKNGTVYDGTVPIDVWEGFVTASSKGSYFAREIRGKYEMTKR